MAVDIRAYRASDWDAICRIHDASRLVELKLAGLEDAFVPLHVAAEREGLLDYPGLYVFVEDGVVAGFVACTSEELAWLYVDPARRRKGIGRQLARFALRQFPHIHSIEVLTGNEPARSLYVSLGFETVETVRGRMPGNEDFTVEVWLMERRRTPLQNVEMADRPS